MRVNSRSVKDLNVKGKTLKLLEENKDKCFQDHRLKKNFFIKHKRCESQKTQLHQN